MKVGAKRREDLRLVPISLVQILVSAHTSSSVDELL